MNRIKSLWLCCFLCVNAYAQEPGYFGKRTFLEIDGQAQLPLLFNLFASEKGYVFRDDAFQKSYNLKDVGFRASIGRFWTENMGVAFEYNQRFYQVNPLRGGELNRQYENASGLVTEYIRPEVEFLEISERMLMPKVVFTSYSGRLPGGLSQEVGLGYAFISIANRKAQAGTLADSSYTGDLISENLVDPEIEELKGMQFMYGLRMNYPLSRSLLFHVGMRYSYSWMLGKRDFRKTEQTEAWISGRELWSRINQRRQLGIIHFGAGFTFCF